MLPTNDSEENPIRGRVIMAILRVGDFMLEMTTISLMPGGHNISTPLPIQVRSSVKQNRENVETETCKNSQNIEKRKGFGEKLLQYEKEGAFIVYYDETNFNLYCKRTQERAPVGERAVVTLPPSKGANLQLQCAVSPQIGLVHYAKQRGSIKMEINAAFVDDIYDAVKSHETYRIHFSGKKIVIVLDHAPAHSQTEELVQARNDLELLRLAPYSSMCNPIEGTRSRYALL
ncbi:unnamed protein product [Phytophthora fragariaefolia]|uniref:Unnamed protein product n=1 Tax=Phytophthora fragariaefolia TaxID=1490495 RepID=A0A9W6Y0L1_9STRA|nr:unnamed protein product [Phytophthora fragariaefolia]